MTLKKHCQVAQYKIGENKHGEGMWIGTGRIAAEKDSGN